MNPLKAWMKLATPDEKRMLAEKVGTSVNYLHHISSEPDKRYHRKASVEMGALIEHYTTAMNRSSNGRLPIVYRIDIVGACLECPFAKKCLGEERVTRSAFREVTPADLELADESEGGNHD